MEKLPVAATLLPKAKADVPAAVEPPAELLSELPIVIGLLQPYKF
jgi:hypothetical protein